MSGDDKRLRFEGRVISADEVTKELGDPADWEAFSAEMTRRFCAPYRLPEVEMPLAVSARPTRKSPAGSQTPKLIQAEFAIAPTKRSKSRKKTTKE